jgi:hypothetical protein
VNQKASQASIGELASIEIHSFGCNFERKNLVGNRSLALLAKFRIKVEASREPFDASVLSEMIPPSRVTSYD